MSEVAAKFKVGDTVWFEHGYIVNGVVSSVRKYRDGWHYSVHDSGYGGTFTNIREKRLVAGEPGKVVTR